MVPALLLLLCGVSCVWSGGVVDVEPGDGLAAPPLHPMHMHPTGDNTADDILDLGGGAAAADDDVGERGHPDPANMFPHGLLQLVMIVKNEASSLRAVLEYALPHCDSWYILDTGSTDGTQELVRAVTSGPAFAGMPGVLEESPFVDFAATRNLALARSGNGTMYKIFIDGGYSVSPATRARATRACRSRPLT